MKCLYVNIDCDWPDPTGDIECTECAHYKKEVDYTSILSWIKELLGKLLNGIKKLDSNKVT